MTEYLTTAFIILLSATTAISLTVAVRAHNKVATPKPGLPEPRPTQLPTRNERWVMEQEHELFPNKPLSLFNHKGCRVCGPGPLRRHEVPSRFDHVYYGEVEFTDDYGHPYMHKAKIAGPSRANIVTSEIEGTAHPTYHTPMLDLDFPCRLLESSTPGHFHLYMDKPVPWRKYKRLLRALRAAELIEPGFYKAARSYHATHLRVPWLEKGASQ